MKVCTKVSIPYLSLHLWLQVCGSFSLTQETKSISCSDLQVEPRHILAVPPLCRCCSLPVQGQQGCGATGLGRVGLTPLSLVLLEWSLLSPQPSWVCARAAVPLPAPSYKCHRCSQCFHHTAQAHENAPKHQLLRAVEHLQTQLLAHSGWKRLFCLFFPSNCFADIFLCACPPWHKKDFG